MIITSCTYFKGIWKSQFDKENTKKRAFLNDQNKEIQIDFMSQMEKFNYFSGKYFEMVELSYVGDRYCLGIILPNK